MDLKKILMIKSNYQRLIRMIDKGNEQIYMDIYAYLMKAWLTSVNIYKLSLSYIFCIKVKKS